MTKNKIFKENSKLIVFSILLCTIAAFVMFACKYVINKNNGSTSEVMLANIESDDGIISTTSGMAVGGPSDTAVSPSISVRRKYIQIGQSIDLDVIDLNDNTILSDQSSFKWMSFNSDIASVDSDGIVKGLSVGYSTIIAETSNGVKVRAIIYVTDAGSDTITVPQTAITHNGTVYVLKDDGTVWGSGKNSDYELGQGNKDTVTGVVRIKKSETEYLDNIVQIDAGDYCGFGLDKDGALWVWGYNGQGQLGTGDTSYRTYAEKITQIGDYEILPKIIQIAAGYRYTLVLLENGDIYATGENGYGQLGNSAYSSSNKFIKTENVSNVVQISTKMRANTFLMQDGSILNCGINSNGQLGRGTTFSGTNDKDYVKNPENDGKLEDIVWVACDDTSIALNKNGEAFVWGYNLYGSFGNGSTSNSSLPIKLDLDSIGITRIKYVASGNSSLHIQDVSGRLFSSGYNVSGRLATSANYSTTQTSFMPVLDDDGNIFEDCLLPSDGVMCASVYTVITKNGAVYIAGDNGKYQYGNNTTEYSYYLERYGNNDIVLSDRQIYLKATTTKQITVKEYNVMNVFHNKKPNYEFKSLDTSIATVSDSGIITGKSIGTTTIIVKDKNTLEESRAIVHVYNNHNGAITIPGASGSYGGSKASANCILKEDGTVWGTGKNSDYEIGTGDNLVRTVFSQTKIDKDTYLTNVVKVQMGDYHSIALTADGEVYTWGYNNYGQLGFGDTEYRKYATKVPTIKEGHKVVDILNGYHCNTVLLDDGTVYVAGRGDYGQIGNGATSNAKVFTQVKNLNNIVALAGTDNRTKALDADGTVWGWGYNEDYSVGDGTKSNRSIPVHVRNKQNQNNLRNIINLVASGTTVAVTEERTGLTWGHNYYGTTGNGGSSNVSLPIDLMLYDESSDTLFPAQNIRELGVQDVSIQVLLDNGELWVAGKNVNGQTSNGNTSAQRRYVKAKEEDGSYVSDAIILGQGIANNNNFIIKKDGSIWVCGINNYGGYGNRTYNNTSNYCYRKTGISTVVLNARNEYLKVGDTFDIDVLKAEEFNAFIQEPVNQSDWTWTSSNEDVATVNSNGVVTAKSMGKTTISGYCSNGMKARAIFSVYNNKTGAITIPDLRQGQGFSIILKEDGTVWSTGNNNYGQLGQGDTTNRNEILPVKIDENTNLTNVIKIETYSYIAVAVTADGSVYSWGYNGDGQAGQGNTSNNTYAVKMKGVDGEGYLKNIIDVSVGSANIYAVDRDGVLYGVGSNSYYELSDAGPSVYYPTIITSMPNVSAVYAGDANVFALGANAEVWARGYSGHGNFGIGSTSTKCYCTYIGNDIISMDASGHTNVGMIKEDNTAWGTGYNNYGNIGVGDNSEKNVFTQVKLKDGTPLKVKYISVGRSSNMFYGKDGYIYAAGDNCYGQLSNGTTTNSSYPEKMLNPDGTPITDVLDISGSIGYYDYHSINNGIIRTDGSVWVTNNNSYGQFGNKTTSRDYYFIQCGVNTVETNVLTKHMKVGETFDIDILNSGTFNVLIQDDTTNEKWTWSSNNEDVASVDENGVVIAKSIGHTMITGYGPNGKKAKAMIYVTRNVDKAIAIPNVINGTANTFVLKEDGTVWATGLNEAGQLGNGTTNSSLNYNQVKINENTYLTDVIQISLGVRTVAALTKNGEVYAWGLNDDDQVCTGSTDNVLYATKIKGVNGEGYLNNITQIAVGASNIFALGNDGLIYSTGNSSYYQRNDSGTFYGYPTVVEGISNAVFVDGGDCNIFAICSDGNTWARGYSGKGNFGVSNSEIKNYLTYISNDISDISMHAYVSTMIIKEDNTVWGTGVNDYGQLGVGNSQNRNVFAKMKTSDGDDFKAKYVSSGRTTSIMIGKDGNLYSAGDNGYGQMSNGTTTGSVYPALMYNKEGTVVNDAIFVTSINGYQSSYTRTLDTTIIRKDGTVWISGNNDNGQFGNGVKDSSVYFTKSGENIVKLNTIDEYIKIGQTFDIEVLYESMFNVFVTENAKQSDWKWKSSNEDVATIDNNGVVKGISVGYTTITGESIKGLKARAIIHVSSNNPGAITVPSAGKGHYFSVVLKEDGTVWASGYNGYGQLGQGNTVDTNIPVQVKIDENTYLTNVKQIAVAYCSVVAVTFDGAVYGWGYNNYGQLGQGNTSNVYYATRVKGVDGNGYLSDIISVEAGEVNLLFIDKNGNTYGTGNGTYYQFDDTQTHRYYPRAIETLKNAVKVSIGDCALACMKSNGETWARGYNNFGAFGNNTTWREKSGVYLLGNDFIDISWGNDSLSVIREDGNLWVAGKNDYGQLALGDRSNRTVFTQVKFEDGTDVKPKYVVTGSLTLTVVDKNNKAYGAGYGGYGELGTGLTSLCSYLTIMKYDENSEADDVLLPISGENSSDDVNTGVIRNDGTVWLAGKNDNGQLGDSTNINSVYLTIMGDGFLNYPEKFIEMEVNESYTININKFNIKDDMNVFTDSISSLGTISYEIEDTEIANIESGNIIKGLKQGITKVLVKDSKTGARTYLWIKVVNDKNVVINAGYRFTVSLKQDKSVWTWGQNTYGQLGLGDNVDYNKPQEVKVLSDKEIVDVKAGYYHTVALTKDGEVYSWGYNGYGQLGNGTTNNSSTPEKIKGLSNIVKIDAYKYMTIALDANGAVYVCGQGFAKVPTLASTDKKVIDIAGNLILAENRRAYNINSNTPYGKDLIKIAAGENHYLGLNANGEIYAWGTNKYGQLGTANNTSSNIPAKVVNIEGTGALSNIVEISAGDNYSIVSDKDGNVYTFGYNGSYRAANSKNTNIPFKITENVGKTELIAASEGGHSVIADWDGFVYTVGWNSSGQLGLEDYRDRSNFEAIGNLSIISNPEKISLHVGETKNVDLTIGSSFNLKNDSIKIGGTINKKITNTSIADISENVVTGKCIGKTFLNATYTGTVGTISDAEHTFYRNIEIDVLPEGGISVPNVDSGNGFTVSLKSDGSVWSWGANNFGQLGLGNTTAYNEPQKIEFTEKIKDIVTGTNHALALTESGKVYAWGLGNYGQLGQGSKYNQISPVVVYNTEGKILEDIVKIEAGDEISFAITSKGEVYAWGKNYSSRAQKLNTKENAIDITSKYILTGDGEVWDIAGENKLIIVGRVSEIDEGTTHTVLLSENGLAYAVGDNTYGQLGNGNNVSSMEAVVAIRKNESDLFTGIKQIKAGDNTTVILANDGNVYVCGMNDCYELGTDDKDILDVNIPRKIDNLDDNVLVAIGTSHVTSVKSNGTVYDWGNGVNGELGNRKNKTSANPVIVGDFIVRSTKNHISIKVGQTETIEGKVDYFNLITNDIKEINYSSKDSSVADVITKINSDGIYEAQITGNSIGTTTLIASQTGSSNIGIIQVEVLQDEVGKTGIVIEPNVATTGSHTVSLRADGKVFTWGVNTYGQLGNGTTKDSDEPIEVQFPEGTIITQIAAGEEYSVALDNNGNVWTWGRNNYYQIGHTGGNQYTPYKVGGLPKVIKIAAGNYTTMVITENKELYGWGFNGYGNIGIGNYTNKVTVNKVVGFEDVIDVSVGKNHSMILTSDGKVYVTGSNLYGQLGNGIEEIFKVNEFVNVNLPDVITALDCGELSSAVITVNGNMYTWGQNAYGQLGLGDKETKFNPTLVSGLNNIREVEMGKTNTIVRDGNGAMYITGSNIYGQLGKGTIGTSTNATYFELLTKIDSGLRLATGDTYVVVLKEDGFVWAWGDYNHGDIEKKSITSSRVPVLVGSDSTSLDSLEVVLQKSEVKNIMANAKFKFNLIYIEDNNMSHFEFTSYNSDIAEIDSDGDILGKREGTTWAKATDTNTGKSNIAIVRVITNSTDYETHVAPKVAAGDDFGVGLKEDGTVWIWGYDDSGLAYSNIPASTNVLSSYKNIDSGKNFSVALRSDGTVWTIGDNKYGQLGQGDNVNRVKYVQIEGLKDIVQIASGDTHTVAVDRFGIVYGWGSNSKGELGQENIGINTTVPVIISIQSDKVMQISAGKNQTVIVANNGKVYGIGEYLNGYIQDQDGVEIEDAVKATVGDNYILVLRQNGTIVKYQYGYTTKVGNVTNAIDISSKGKVNMYQSSDEKTYTWGDNIYGQLGLNSINKAFSNPILVQENSTNTFRIGAGYNNSFIISNTGFVYGAGRNINGELGNGTSTDSNSPTFTQSLTHTLVGNRMFEVYPESKILEINEIENLSVKANGFNVFGEINPNIAEYTWSSDDNNVVSILNPGEIQAVNEGTTKVKIKDTIINQEVEIERIVVPVDTDRIKTITANGIEALASAAYTYEAKIPLDDSETTANVVIATKNESDKISIDNGNTWTTESIATIVDIPGNTAELAFVIQTEAGNKLNYTLNLIRQSNKNTLAESGVTVKKAGTSDFVAADKNANNQDLYEIVIPSIGVNIVKVDAEDNNSMVSINGMMGTLATQNYNFVMPAGMNIKDIPIKVTSESGREKDYILRAYTSEYVTTLKSVYVNQIEAVVNSDGDYEVVIDDFTNISEVRAITNVATSKVGINEGDKEVNQIVKNIVSTEDITSVTIEVESNDGNCSESYNLIIKKKRANSRIQSLKVDGTEIQELNGVYEATGNTDAVTAEVEIVAKDTIYHITLADFDEEQFTITKLVDINSDTVKYSIAVRNEEDESIENYVLILHKCGSEVPVPPGTLPPSEIQEVGIKYLYATNAGVNRYAVQDSEDKNKFIIKVPDSFTSTYLTVIGTNNTSNISINSFEYEVGMSVKEVSLKDKETVVPVHIEIEDGALTADYEVIIIRASEDTGLKIELNEYPNDAANSLLNATLINADTYFIQLKHPVDVVDIIATTNDSNAYVKIMQNEYQLNVDKLDSYKITEYETELKVIVISESGVEKEYKLIIKTLEDNVDLDYVEVNGEMAVYNAVSGKYEIRRAKTENSYKITAVTIDSDAMISIDGDTQTANKASKTVTKLGNIHNSTIQVKSANGLNEKEYQLEIIEKSDNAEIETIKINGQIIMPESDGNYIVNVNHTIDKLEIYGQTVESHAQITIDGETTYQNNIVITRNMSNAQEQYNITVVSEDETAVNTRTLTVNKLSGNTDISEITINTPDDVTYKLSDSKVIIKDDGTYYCKIKRNSQAEIGVVIADNNAKVSVIGGSDTETVTLLNDITDINIVVTAEDGTLRTAILKIERESEDAKLKNLVINNTAENSNLITPTVSNINSSSYEVKVDDRATELDVTAITNHLEAQIKLGADGDEDYVVNTMSNKIVSIDGVSSFTIDVKPECGAPVLTYTIEITKIYNKDIKKVVTDDELAACDGIVYSGWISANDNIANIEVTADNPLTQIELYNEGNLIANGTGVMNFQDINVAGNSKQYKIKSINPNNSLDSKEYLLKITKKSTNNEVEFVKLNGVSLMKKDGIYKAVVGFTNQYMVSVGAEDEYAQICFEDGNYINSNKAEYEIENLQPGQTKQIKFKVKSQNGDETEEQIIEVYRQDNNVNVTNVIVGGKDITATYDKKTKAYNIVLENTINQTEIEIDLESALSTIDVDIDELTHSNIGNITVSDVTLPGCGRKEIRFTVTAEDGIQETRKIIISQFSSSIELENVKLNGKEATKRSDGDYEIVIGDLDKNASIYAKAVNANTKISINNQTADTNSSTSVMQNILVAGTTFNVPIKAIAEDGTEYEYILYVTVKSGDNSLEYIKVDSKNVTEEISSNVFRIFVDENASSVPVIIKALGDLATVSTELNGTEITGNPITFNKVLADERTSLKFKITSESGNEKEFELQIFKISSDNTLNELYVNGNLLEKNPETGRYYYSINDGDANPRVKAIATNEFAYVRIALFAEDTNISEHIINMSKSKITTIPITIRSQTGVSNVEYLDIETIYATSIVETMIVDDTEVTSYNGETKTYTAYINSEINPHEVFIMASNTYAKIEFNGDIDDGNLTTYVYMEENEYEKLVPLKITSETGVVSDFTLRLVKLSDNVNVQSIMVNDVTITPDEDNSSMYRQSIKKLANRAKIKVITEYPYATVKIADEEAKTNISEMWVNLSLLEDVITVPVVVMATDGETIETYNIVLTRASNDCRADVSYNGVELIPADDEKYYVSILDTETSGLIEVTANDSKAKIDINNTGVIETGTKTYTLNIDTEKLGRYIEVPISIIAEDDTIEDTSIIITRISTNANTDKVEGIYEVPDGETIKQITEQAQTEEGIYVLGVKESTKELKLNITLENENAKITRGTDVGIGSLETMVTLNDKVTYVNYTVVAEDGVTIKTETVKIIKQVSDTSIGKLVVDGTEITLDIDGKYHASVEGGTSEAQVKITTISEQATIKLDKDSNKAYLETKVTTNNVKNTYIITIIAEDKTEKDYILEITKQTNIAGQIITENFEGKHKSTVYVFKTDDSRAEDLENYLLSDNSVNPNVRAVIEKVETKEDGSFIVNVNDIEKYDILVIKDGYLNYRVNEIQVKQGEKILLDKYNLLAGDIVESGEIEIDDLVTLNDSFGVTITDENKSVIGTYDFNEDGIINDLDRNILKKNYNKKSEVIIWVDPKAPVVMKYSFKEECGVDSSENKFILPMTCDYTISSNYGTRAHPVTGETKFHSGIDIVGTHHTEIISVADGEVTYAGVQNGYGNCVEIKHIVDGVAIYSFYAHLSQIDVCVGDIVSQGQVIGLEGGAKTDPNHGTSTGHHLHFELRDASGSGHSLNPNDFIKF